MNRAIHLSKRKTVKILLVLAAGLILISVLRSILIYDTVRNNFCTANDEIYQAIRANIASWVINDFRPNQSSSRNHLDFSTPNGQGYTAIGMELDRFFVVTEYDYPHSYLGKKGYIYSPSGMDQDYTEYHYTPLGENLFCYESKF